MKAFTAAQRLYWNERCEAEDGDGGGNIASLAHVMSLQAVHIGNMIQSRRQNSLKGVFDHWVKMEQLNDNLVGLVMAPFRSSPAVDANRLDRLRRVTLDMARGYTSTIAELVLFGNVEPKKLQNVIEAEARFFAVALGSSNTFGTNAEAETRRHWQRHTNSVINMLKACDDDDNFHYAAAHCIINGKLLGSWLDGVFLNK